MPVPKCNQRAVTKYMRIHYDSIMIRGKKGIKDQIQQAAASAGLSVNAYILQAINERMQREGISPAVSPATDEQDEDD